MTETFRNDLINHSEKIGIKLSEIQIEQLYKFYIMLVEKNKVMNLTAITEEHDVIVKHFIDSMSI
ncbi:MAG: class I SAM-dependent methyltransferase, partial [Oribacterium sp.]|nr:class I SAM-dependent methyltransferase [Oribacterium sp.]